MSGLKADAMPVKIAGGVGPLTVMVNGVPCRHRRDGAPCFLRPMVPASCGSRSWRTGAEPTASWCVCSDSRIHGAGFKPALYIWGASALFGSRIILLLSRK